VIGLRDEVLPYILNTFGWVGILKAESSPAIEHTLPRIYVGIVERLEQDGRRLLEAAGERKPKQAEGMESKNQAQRPCIIALGERQYRVDDGEPVAVSNAEDRVLREFVRQPAMDEPTLIRKTAREHAARILRNLAANYPEFATAIRLPKGKNQGGYHVNIRENP
jgi:hypothetical protein